MIEKVVKYFSIITICAFILGYLKLDSYYESFNITILNYIGPSELLIALLPFTTILVLMGFGWSYLEPEELFSALNGIYTKQIRIGSIILILVLFVLILTLKITLGVYRLESLLHAILYFIGGIPLFFVSWKTTIDKNNLTFRFLAMYVYIGFAITQYYSKEAVIVKKWGDDHFHSFIWKGKNIRTDSNLIFIGETQSYLFFYNHNDSSSIAYKKNEVDSIAIK